MIIEITVCAYRPLSDEGRLLDDLMETYPHRHRRFIRPLLNSADKTTVQFGMRLIQMDIDEKEQHMQVSVWVRMVR